MSKIEDIRIHLKASDSPANVKVTAENVRKVYENDYSLLKNIPTINGVPVVGNKQLSDFSAANISVKTTAEWSLTPTYIPGFGELIVYSDYDFIEQDGHQIPVPGIKVGDGNAYVVDLPFVSNDISVLQHVLEAHIEDEEKHVTTDEKDFWNNKLNCSVNEEELIFNRL